VVKMKAAIIKVNDDDVDFLMVNSEKKIEISSTALPQEDPAQNTVRYK
jgi:hypothetical protein